MSKSVITPPAMLSYPYLDKAQEGFGDGAPKFSAVFVVSAGRDLTELENAISEAAESKWPGKSQAMFKSGALRHPIRSGAEKDDYPDDSRFFSARSEQQPGLVLLPQEAGQQPPRVGQNDIRVEFYPGCFVRASVKAYAYDKKGNKGVGLALNNVQKLAEGTRIDGRKNAEDEFDVDVDLSGLEVADDLV